MSVQPETSALLCNCILSSTHGSTHVAGVLQLATCHPHKKLSVLQMLCKRNCMLCRKVTVKRLRMSKQEAVVYEHAKTAALQQMQASHKSVCQLSKVPCCAIASKRIGFDMSPDSPDCKRTVTLTSTQQSSQIRSYACPVRTCSSTKQLCTLCCACAPQTSLHPLQPAPCSFTSCDRRQSYP